MKTINSFLTLIAFTVSCTSAPALEKDKLRDQLIKHEGKRSKVYKDNEGIPTIGVGFNLNRSDAKKKIESLGLDYDKVLAGQQMLSDQQIGKLLDEDIDQSIRDCKSIFPEFGELSDTRQRVLVDMMFNLGKTRFLGFENMIAAVKAKDFNKAADEMVNSKWYKQVGNRAKTLVKMMRDG